MSDPMTNTHIEDVLTSIRRLVAEGEKGRSRAAVSETPEGEGDIPATAKVRGDAEAPVEATARFVLTPALRVGSDPARQTNEPPAANSPVETPAAEDPEGSDQPLDAHGHLNDAMLNAVDETIEDVAPPPVARDLGERADREWARALAEEFPEPAASPRRLGATIAGLEAAVTRQDVGFEPDGSEVADGTRPEIEPLLSRGDAADSVEIVFADNDTEEDLPPLTLTEADKVSDPAETPAEATSATWRALDLTDDADRQAGMTLPEAADGDAKEAEAALRMSDQGAAPSDPVETAAYSAPDGDAASPADAPASEPADGLGDAVDLLEDAAMESVLAALRFRPGGPRDARDPEAGQRDPSPLRAADVPVTKTDRVIATATPRDSEGDSPNGPAIAMADDAEATTDDAGGMADDAGAQADDVAAMADEAVALARIGDASADELETPVGDADADAGFAFRHFNREALSRADTRLADVAPIETDFADDLMNPDADDGVDAGFDAELSAIMTEQEGPPATLDNAALRKLVKDVVREELQGELGERITRNVRRMVRREINQVLAAQGYD